MQLLRPWRRRKEPTGGTQITVTFSSAIRRVAAQQAIADAAELAGVNKGSVASRAIEQVLIPLNGPERDVYAWSLDGYDGKKDPYPENTGVFSALEYVFGLLAAGENGKAIDNGDPVDYVLLAERMAWRSSLMIHEPISEDDPRVNLRRDLLELGRTHEWAVELAERLSERRPDAYPFFVAVTSHWAEIRDLTCTYSMLTYLVAACENRVDTAEDRRDLLEACKNVQARREKIESEKREEVQMRDLTLMDGAILRIPAEWPIINAGDADRCPFAGVIEAKNVPGAPHVAFLSRIPVDAMSTEEETELIAKVGMLFPLFMDAKAQEVEVERDADGNIANLAEWSASPRVGVFAIGDADEYDDQRPAPYGAVVVRVKGGATS